jgi:integrase
MNEETLLIELFDTAYEPCQLAIASDGSKQQHKRNIRRASELLGRPAKISDLSDDLVARVCALILSSGKKPGTANKCRSQMAALWSFAARRGLIKTWPTIRKYRDHKREPTAWGKEQLGELFEACRRIPGWIGPVRAYLWWIALHSVLWDTGLRIGATLRLRLGQIDWSRGLLLVEAEQQKNDEDQWFRLHDDTLAILRAIYTDRETIFPWPFCKGTLWQRYRKILKDAGLPQTSRDKFHKMRRSVASWFEEAGGNATELLGHSSRAVTLGYIDKTIVGKVHATDLLFRPDRPPPPPRAA